VIEIPHVIGHRGAAAVAPENTVASFEAAAAAGARWVELDVRLTADGVPVVTHDETLARTNGVNQRIDRMRASDLDSQGGGPAIPTLDETLDCLERLGLGANIEIKPERRVAEMARAVVAALARRPVGAGVLVSSFDLRLLRVLARTAPCLPRGMLLRRPLPTAARLARRLGCVSIHCEQTTLSERHVARWRGAGLVTMAYTVNDASRALRLMSWGLDAVITDDPAAMIARLGARHPSRGAA
jgi:glycerophosphoryl diester phosphodiesterase